MNRYRWNLCFVLCAAAAALVGCKSKPAPKVATGVDGKTYQGVDPAREEQTPADSVSMARPVIPPPAATAARQGAAPSGLTVQYTAPSLERPLSEIPDQELAEEALARIGPPAVPSLVQALSHQDPLVRREAAKVLMRMGPDAKDAAPELTRLLDDPDQMVRKYATKALGNIGPDAAVAVPALMLELLQPRPEVPDQRR